MSSHSFARLLVAPAVAGALIAGPLALATPAEAATAPTAAAAQTWQPRPAQYTQTSVIKDLAIPMSDGVKLRGDLTLPGQRRRHPDRRQGAGRRHDHRLQQDRHRGRLRRDARRRGPGVPRQARLRPAHRRRPRHRLVARASGTRSTSARTSDAAEVMTWAHSAAVEQRQHRDDRGRPTWASARSSPPPASPPGSRRSSRRCPPPTSTATWSPPAARSTRASCRCGSGWSRRPA